MREGRSSTVYTIEITDETLCVRSLTMENREFIKEVRWDEVERAYAYKEDLITTDCICIGFEVGSDGGLCVHEEMKGWRAMLDRLPSLLSGVRPYEDWFDDVAFPAFAQNLITIYPVEAEQAGALNADLSRRD